MKMKTGNLTLQVSLVMLFLTATLMGCNAYRVDKADVDQVRTGMTVEEVDKILGPPDETEEVELPLKEGEIEIDGDEVELPKTSRRSVWKEEGRTVTITFIGDKVNKVEREGF